jgi:cephalosporin hydroxylase
MHPMASDLFDGLRFAPFGGRRAPSHGGTRMIDLEQTTRSMDDTCAEIARERAMYAEAIDAFHRVFYASRQTHGMTFYEGVPVLKNPLDLWVAQEIIWDLQPTLIIETGTAHGGSALFYARQLDRVGTGKVVSIDLDPAERLPQHPRITYVRGSSTRQDIVGAIAEIAQTHPRVMVVLDSDHSKRHVLDELDAYAPLVTPNHFLVVEDTNLNGRPVPIDWKGGPGPGMAVDEWLPEHPEFARAPMAERYLVTFHTWLRRSTCETA